MVNRNSIWNSAGLSGIILGGVSILYVLCNMLTAELAKMGTGAGIAAGLLNAILWVGKFYVSITIMKTVLYTFSREDADAGRREIFRRGVLVAFLSALVYSAFYMAYMQFMAPDVFSEALDILRENPAVTEEAYEMFENMMPMMPTYTFIGNLIYCTLFGTVVSAIFSNKIMSDNPFDE